MWYHTLILTHVQIHIHTHIFGKESTCNVRRPQFNPWIGKMLWRRDRLPTPVFLGFPCSSVSQFSHSVVSDSLQPHGLQHARPPCPSPAPGVGSLSLLQGIFQTQGLNPGLPHCRQILYQLSHKGSPRILEWVAYPFSSRSSQSRNQTGVFRTAGGFFTSWAIREALI